MEGLKTKRKELEASRESIVRQMQQFHAQIAVRRKEGLLDARSIFSLDTNLVFRKRSLETEISYGEEEDNYT